MRLCRSLLRPARFLFAVVVALTLAACPSVREEDNGPREDAPPYHPLRGLEMGRLMLYSYQQLTDFTDGAAFAPPEGYTLEAELVTYEWFSANTTMVGDDPTPILFLATRGDDI